MDFSIDFLLILGASWLPTWLILAAKTRLDGARSPPGGVQNRGKTELGSEDGSEIDLGSILDGFFMVLGSILDGFRMDFLNGFIDLEWVLE